MGLLSGWTKVYITAAIAGGVASSAIAFAEWTPEQTVRFSIYLAAAFFSSNMQVKLPGICSGISVNFVFTLVGMMDLGLPQVICLGAAGTLGQFLLGRKSWHPVQVTFNLSIITLATFAAYSVYHSSILRSLNSNICLLLLASSAALFLVNTGLVTGVIALTERKNAWRVWVDNFMWTGSPHFVGAALAAVWHYENIWLGWEAMVLTAPVIYFVYRSYSLHLISLEEANRHAEELGGLHWRAIEALALAIDAKDETTHTHLMRVKVYAHEIGKELKLNNLDMQALQAAALLHDIGKLAVPEYIISKPGKLTPAEFDKMKIHPVVGAEILASIRFPYPVVPIVHSHHEKWNGQGYPDGLAGEQIPLGARILAAVDCLDALASDRQYRRALPLEKAMDVLISESGKSFDPKIVEILRRRYVELERLASAALDTTEAKLSKNVKIERGGGPATGFEETAPQQNGLLPLHYMLTSASVRREFQNLVELTREAAGSLTENETLSLVATRLKRFIAHDSVVIYLKEGDSVFPRYSTGAEGGFFGECRLGEGLSGWVAENDKSIVNGNPGVEPGYPLTGRMRSALSIPLEKDGSVFGVVTLYSISPDCFSKEDQRTLLSVSTEIGMVLEQACQGKPVQAANYKAVYTSAMGA